MNFLICGMHKVSRESDMGKKLFTSAEYFAVVWVNLVMLRILENFLVWDLLENFLVWDGCYEKLKGNPKIRPFSLEDQMRNGRSNASSVIPKLCLIICIFGVLLEL